MARLALRVTCMAVGARSKSSTHPNLTPQSWYALPYQSSLTLGCKSVTEVTGLFIRIRILWNLGIVRRLKIIFRNKVNRFSSFFKYVGIGQGRKGRRVNC